MMRLRTSGGFPYVRFGWANVDHPLEGAFQASEEHVMHRVGPEDYCPRTRRTVPPDSVQRTRRSVLSSCADL